MRKKLDTYPGKSLESVLIPNTVSVGYTKYDEHDELTF